MKKKSMIYLSIIIFSVCIAIYAFQRNKEIMSYVTSGLGTFDDPYVLKDDENDYLKTFNERVVENITKENEFNYTLTHPSYSNQYNGGKWENHNLVNDTSRDFVYTKIQYINEDDSENLYVALTNEHYRKTLVNNLISHNINDSTFITEEVIVSNIVNLFEINPITTLFNKNTCFQLANALEHNNGSMIIQYKLRHNGSWFTSMVVVEWTTYPNIYVPKEYNEVGTYSSN